ncbi:Hydroxyisourate hydrolase [Imleria badia]|nr:Hydroxyisourate hydrolase [Imleria badia]
MTVLDVSLGKPAEGVHVSLQQFSPSSVSGTVVDPLLFSVTDADGRCMALLPPRDSEEAKQAPQFQIAAGIYKIVFKPKEYFEKTGRKCFYPWIEIPFHVENPDEHHHIPLLISPYSFTTYRGT